MCGQLMFNPPCVAGACLTLHVWPDQRGPGGGGQLPVTDRPLQHPAEVHHQDVRRESWLTVSWLAGCLAGWLAGWLSVWLAGWLVGWMIERLAGWRAGWLNGWLVV